MRTVTGETNAMIDRLRLLVVLLALALLGETAAAQDFPARPLRIIVPISVGSVTDVAARLMAQELQQRLGQTVVVLNKPGGAMAIGGSECAKSAPDGYTLCLVSPDTMSFNPLTIPDLPYDPQKDFVPVIDMYHVVEGLIARADLGVNSVADLRARAVAQPGKLNFGTLGQRTTTDAFRQWLGEQWGTSFGPVPYKGGSEVVNALLASTIDVTKIGLGNLSGQFQGRNVKVLALTSSRRWPQLPDVPTFAEASLGGFPGGPIYWGVVVPTRTPAAIAARLHDELAQILRGEKFTAFAAQNFLDPIAGSAADFAAFLKKDRENAAVLVDKYMKQ
jgi:tripartite-type tricarboxylate transporter receptor subunit TctC